MQVKTIILGLGIGAIGAALLGCGQEQNNELLGNFQLDVPIVYVKRPLDDIDDGQNPRNAIRYKPGGHLYIREFASPNAQEFNITANKAGGLLDVIMNGNNVEREAGDVAMPDVSFDGKRIVFAMKEGDYATTPAGGQPKWDLWEYVLQDGQGIDEGSLQRLINLDTVANKGNDFDPTYLPDGRIVFSSDRSEGKRAIITAYEGIDLTDEPLLNESGNEAAVNLHILNPSDQSLEQVSFNASHELSSSILSNGQIVYSRWENIKFPGSNKNVFDLFAVNPDGTQNNILYGAHSHAAATSAAVFLNAREMQNGQLVANLMPTSDSFSGGDLVAIDYQNFVDINTKFQSSGSTATVGQVSLTGNTVSRGSGYSTRGRYTTPFPLWDNTNRLLVAWAPCETEDVNRVRRLCALPGTDLSDPAFAAPPAYGIWIFDVNSKTQRHILLPEPGMTITDPVAMVDRFDLGNYPDVIVDQVPDSFLRDQFGLTGAGKVKITSVYDSSNLNNVGNDSFALGAELPLPCLVNGVAGSCGTAGAVVDLSIMVTRVLAERPVPYVRVVRAPAVFGRVNNDEDMREIVGYHAVEADGSVVMTVPANWPFNIELVDAQGRKFRTHRNWLQVKPGMTLECQGCHENHSRTAPLNSMSPTLAETADSNDMSGLYPDLSSDLPGALVGERHADLVLTVNPVIDYALLPDRTIINYETHIQPLWMRDRSAIATWDPALTALGVTACTSCHAETELVADGMGGFVSVPKLPDGQLTLTITGLHQSADQNFTGVQSYVDLLEDDNLLELVELNPVVNPGVFTLRYAQDNAVPPANIPLADCTFDLGNDGNCDRPIIHRANSRNDGSFYRKMTTTASHMNMLEPIELLLIQEWIDMGVPYTSDSAP